MREVLCNLYSVLKAQDAHLQFVFLTGVSKSSEVSMVSGLNPLRDIVVNAGYCGA